MSSIGGIGGNLPVNGVNGQSKVQSPARSAQSSPTRSDSVELSGYLDQLKTGSGVRADKVASVRAQIEAGTYEDDYKLDMATSGLLDDLNAN